MITLQNESQHIKSVDFVKLRKVTKHFCYFFGKKRFIRGEINKRLKQIELQATVPEKTVTL